MGIDRPRPRTLAEALRTLPARRIEELLIQRPDLLVDPPRDLADLASRSTLTASIARALDQLDAWHGVVAEGLASLPDPSSVTDLAELLSHPVKPVSAAVERLRSQALLWGTDDQLHLVRTVREAFEPFPGGLAPPSARPLDQRQIDEAVDEVGPEATPVLERLLWAPTGTVRRADRTVTPSMARSPVEQLLSRQLLRPLDSETVLIPREVAWRLRGGRFSSEPIAPTPPTVTGKPRDATLVDRAGAGAAFALLHDIELVVHRVEAVPHRLLRTGGLATRDIVALGRSLTNTAAYAAFVVECASAAGLLAAATNGTLLPTSDCDRWLRAPAGRQWQQVARSWLVGDRLFVRSADPGAHALGPEARSLVAVRLRAVVRALAIEAGVGTVIDLASLADALAWMRPRLTAGHLGATAFAEATWREAAWLGLVALGAPTSFMTAVGDPAPLPARLGVLFPDPVERLVIQADLTAVAAGPLAHPVAEELRLLADQESRGGGGVYRFSASSLRRAFDAGRSAGEVERWLEAHSTTGVPQPLSYLVADVARRHGTIRVGPASSYIRVEDESQAAALLAHPEAAMLGLRSVAPGVLVSAVDEAEVVGLLRELGHTPAVENAAGEVLTAPTGVRAPRRRSERPPSTLPASEVAAGLLTEERRLAERGPRASFPPEHTATEDALDQLRRATRTASPVRVVYVTADGGRAERDLAPLDLQAGAIRAVDRTNAEVLTIPLARISSVVPASGAH